jgi:hypothetical protein
MIDYFENTETSSPKDIKVKVYEKFKLDYQQVLEIVLLSDILFSFYPL